jgi:ureidoglycolate hydrolase
MITPRTVGLITGENFRSGPPEDSGLQSPRGGHIHEDWTNKMVREVIATPLDVLSAPAHGLQVITTPASCSASELGNQGTALVARKLTSFPSSYASASSGKPSSCNTAYFRCTPRQLLQAHDGRTRLQIKVFERHPYTRQAFFPMGRDATKRAYVVIVTEDKSNFCK